MNTLRIKLVVLMLFGVASSNSWSDEPATLQPLASFKEVKTWHEQFMQGEPTKAQRLEAMRNVISSSPIGSRGLNQIYHNFEGRYSIDPTIPGVEKTVLMQRSASKAQAKGYRRELLYAVAYHNDPRYSLSRMNEPLKRAWGNTDADLVIQHRPTGLSGRVEVKDYSLNSQRTNLAKLQAQIDKMSLEGKWTGQPQFWMNARPVIPEIHQYAQSRGVYVSGNVRTGKTTAPGSMSILEAMNQHDQQFYRAANYQRGTLGGGEIAFGAWKIKNTLPKWLDDLREFDAQASYSTTSLLRVGESSSSIVAGGSMILSGSAFTSARLASDALQSRLYSIGKIGGLTSVAALGLSETFHVSRYLRGDVMSQEFWTDQWVIANASAGGLAGWWAGAAVGKNPWAAFIGTNAGTFIGNELGTRTAGMYYEHKFGELDRAYGKWVYARYAIK